MILDKNSRSAIINIKSIKKLTKSGMEHAFDTSAVGLRKATSDQILIKPKGGRTYTYRTPSGRRRRHVASAPGETHANLHGALRWSLGYKVNGANSLEFGYGVQSKSPAPDYASAIEFGSSRIKARPSLSNGINSQVRNFQKNFQREIGKRLEGRGGLIK